MLFMLRQRKYRTIITIDSFLLKKLVAKADQIVPYFVMDTLGDIPGLSGLFIAGIFSASLR